VQAASVTALVGGNGAGKTTTMRIIAGLLGAESGDIRFEGVSIRSWRSSRRVEAGIVLVPEGRLVFAHMSVRDNLRLGAYAPHARRRARERMDRVFSLFPRLAERRDQLAGTLSGGEQRGSPSSLPNRISAARWPSRTGPMSSRMGGSR
jgi:branched-chain amino acid transport system ATP-binding protein